MKHDYSNYKCPYEHLEKECGHGLRGPGGYENVASVWCVCGYRGPVLYLDPEELRLELAKPEEDLPWWLVPGMVVQSIHAEKIIYLVAEISENKIIAGGFEWMGYLKPFCDDHKPIGGPFDMLPEWATHIHFQEDGHWAFVIRENGKDHLEYFPIWHNCPDAFKGNTYSLEGLR